MPNLNKCIQAGFSTPSHLVCSNGMEAKPTLYFNDRKIEQIGLNRVYPQIRSKFGQIKDSILIAIKIAALAFSFIFTRNHFSTEQIEKDVKKASLEQRFGRGYFDEAATLSYNQQPEEMRKFLTNSTVALKQGVDVSSPLPQVENATWYIDWTSWDTPIPKGVNTVNIFVGQITQVNGSYTMNGFGTISPSVLASFVQQCHAQGISVKMSVGGGGGSYDNCWDILDGSNTQAVAQGLVTFCHQYGVDGVDFDYEEFKVEQEPLVGQLIKNFKALDPTLQSSLCLNAGFPNWTPHVKNICDAAVDDKGNCAIDRAYIMSYYDPIQSEEGWVTSWAEWFQQNYKMTPAQVTVGLDDFDSHAYNISDFAGWAKTQGYSTGYWAWNPATPDQSNQTSQLIWNIYHPSKSSQQTNTKYP